MAQLEQQRTPKAPLARFVMIKLALGVLATVSLTPAFASIQSEAKLNHIALSRAVDVHDCSVESAKWGNGVLAKRANYHLRSLHGQAWRAVRIARRS